MSIVNFINGSSFASELARTFVMHLRFYYLWNKYTMKKLRNTNPVPQGMRKARRFFSRNKNRIENISGFLADEESRDTFHKLIHMRQFYEDDDIPRYNYFNQYFPRDIIKFDDGEVFVDGGGFTGDTLLRFRKLNPSYAKIVTFEPDHRNLKQMCRKVGGYRNYLLLTRGCLIIMEMQTLRWLIRACIQ